MTLLLALLNSAAAGMLTPIVDQSGSLDRHDQTVSDGSYADIYPVQVEAGDRLLADLTSRKFDTYLMLQSPSGETFQNDDLRGTPGTHK